MIPRPHPSVSPPAIREHAGAAGAADRGTPTWWHRSSAWGTCRLPSGMPPCAASRPTRPRRCGDWVGSLRAGSLLGSRTYLSCSWSCKIVLCIMQVRWSGSLESEVSLVRLGRAQQPSAIGRVWSGRTQRSQHWSAAARAHCPLLTTVPGTQVLIISLKAGGVGLNLTAANHVVHYDLWWALLSFLPLPCSQHPLSSRPQVTTTLRVAS